MSTNITTQISSGQLKAAYNNSTIDKALVDTPQDQQKAEETKGVHPKGGLSGAVQAGSVGLSSPSLEGVNWDALAEDLSTTESMSISIAEIMVLLVKCMSDMRKGQRDAWMADAQSSLAMGLNAADRMRESAAAKLACDVVSNSATIVASAISIGASVGSMIKTSSVTSAVDLKANNMLKADLAASGLTDADLSVQAPAPGQVQAQQIQLDNLKDIEAVETGDMSGANWKNNPIHVTPDDVETSVAPEQMAAKTEIPSDSTLKQSAQTTPVQEEFDHLEGFDAKQDAKVVDSAKPSEPQSDVKSQLSDQSKQAKAKEIQSDVQKWRTQEIANQMAPFNARVDIATKVGDISAAVMKMGGNVGEYYSSKKQAEAQEARSRGDFFNSLASAELDFANELRDSIKAAMDAMQNVESARHQAMQGIYGI